MTTAGKTSVFVPDYQFAMNADFWVEKDRWLVEESCLPVLFYDVVEVGGRDICAAFEKTYTEKVDGEVLLCRYTDVMSDAELVVFND